MRQNAKCLKISQKEFKCSSLTLIYILVTEETK